MYPRFATGALDISGGYREGVGADFAPGAVQNAMQALMATQAFQDCLSAQCQPAPAMRPPCDPCGGGPQFWMNMVRGGPGVAYGGFPGVVDRPLTRFGELPLGFKQTSIAPSTPTNVVSRPQVLFRGERLVVASSIASNFDILDVKVGNKSILVNDVELPAEIFTQDAVGVRLSMDTAVVAQDISISVNNIDDTVHDFRAAIIGTAAY